MFEHRFLPLKNDDSFRNPLPLKDHHRACDHNAMLAFPQEKISHYTTDYTIQYISSGVPSDILFSKYKHIYTIVVFDWELELERVRQSQLCYSDAH